MRNLLFVLLGAVLVSAPAYGQAPQIYVAGPLCRDHTEPLLLQFGTNRVTTFEIRAHAPLGAQSFEFSIPGFDASAGVVVGAIVPNPTAVSAEGNPFAEGSRISFATCQSTPVSLYTVTIMITGPNYDIFEVLWTVAPHAAPTVPEAGCATASGCGSGNMSCLIAAPPEATTLQPQNPSPADGATNVSIRPELRYDAFVPGYCSCLQEGCTLIYFGEDPDPQPYGACNAEFPIPRDLQPSTTYYWRVSILFCDYVIGPVWSFTTEPPFAVETSTWSNVKQIFR